MKNKKDNTMIRVHKEFKDNVKVDALKTGLSIRQFLQFLYEQYGEQFRDNFHSNNPDDR